MGTRSDQTKDSGLSALCLRTAAERRRLAARASQTGFGTAVYEWISSQYRVPQQLVVLGGKSLMGHAHAGLWGVTTRAHGLCP